MPAKSARRRVAVEARARQARRRAQRRQAEARQRERVARRRASGPSRSGSSASASRDERLDQPAVGRARPRRAPRRSRRPSARAAPRCRRRAGAPAATSGWTTRGRARASGSVAEERRGERRAGGSPSRRRARSRAASARRSGCRRRPCPRASSTRDRAAGPGERDRGGEPVRPGADDDGVASRGSATRSRCDGRFRAPAGSVRRACTASSGSPTSARCSPPATTGAAVDAHDLRVDLGVGDAEVARPAPAASAARMVLLLVPAERQAELEDRVRRAHQDLRLRHRRVVMLGAR